VDPTDAEPDTDAASYWRAEPPTIDADSDELDNVRFARLLASAYRRPTGLISHLRPTTHGVIVIGAIPPRQPAPDLSET
jgi:hypothetical protein